ncbi:casein kinase I [Gaertneriomyces sp. JEL0708]|nr:casein kinase I [Gaertneriomyces sp. JEL0708]
MDRQVSRQGDSRQPASKHHQSMTEAQKAYYANPTVVGGHFRVGKKIGEGSFGIIYEGEYVHGRQMWKRSRGGDVRISERATGRKSTIRDRPNRLCHVIHCLLTINLACIAGQDMNVGNKRVAIKFEPRKAETPQLRDEYRMYKLMSGTVGVPQCYHFGSEGLHSVLVIDLLGPSIEDLFELCGRKFSVKTVCMLAKQLIRRIQSVHQANFVYRDVKPDNFLIGRVPRHDEKITDDPNHPDPYSIVANHTKENPSPTSQISIVDFGMVKQYRDPRTGIHIPFREKKSLSGTARYMSINTHLGREQGRRDDMEALGHVFFYLLNGHLPWQGLKANSNRQKYERIGEVKQAVKVGDLGVPNPEEFVYYLEYARQMGFDEEPNYDGACDLIDEVMKHNGWEDDGLYDWMYVLDEQRKTRREREARRRYMSNEERREDDRREREERLEREREIRYEQEMRRDEYERKIFALEPKLMENMASYFSFSSKNAGGTMPVRPAGAGRTDAGVRQSVQPPPREGAGIQHVRPAQQHQPDNQEPAGLQTVQQVVEERRKLKKKKWWKKMFFWCGRDDKR